jgi:hypothetical protein
MTWIDADLLAGAIKWLTPEQQQVIELKFVHGLDAAEVAQIMDKRGGAVRALQLRRSGATRWSRSTCDSVMIPGTAMVVPMLDAADERAGTL